MIPAALRLWSSQADATAARSPGARMLESAAGLEKIRKRLLAFSAAVSAGRHWKAVLLPEIRPAFTAKARRYITVASVIKNEGAYLAEWLDFHRRLGVEHFVLYDNGSTDNTVLVCRPYIDAGLVTLVPWANFSVWLNQQRAAYAHALANFGGSTVWMGFFDIDEFMFPVREPSLVPVLKQRERLPALAVAGINFGTSGHQRRPSAGVLRSYHRAVPMDVQRGHRLLVNTKCFVRPERVAAVVSAHWFRLRDDAAVGYTERGLPIHRRPWRQAERLSVDVIRYNHYFTRSREEFERKVRGTDVRGPYWSSSRQGKRRMFVLIEGLAEEDRAIERLLPSTASQ